MQLFFSSIHPSCLYSSRALSGLKIGFPDGFDTSSKNIFPPDFYLFILFFFFFEFLLLWHIHVTRCISLSIFNYGREGVNFEIKKIQIQVCFYHLLTEKSFNFPGPVSSRQPAGSFFKCKSIAGNLFVNQVNTFWMPNTARQSKYSMQSCYFHFTITSLFVI